MRKFFTALLLLLLPVAGFAIGLGKITVNSALNQPFNAEVTLLAVDDIPLADIRVSLGTNKDFQRVDLERAFILTKLRFKVTRNSAGQAVILVTSHERITEPFLQFLIDVSWPKGQFFRAYTVLLDPPNYSTGSSQAVTQPSRVVVDSEETLPAKPAITKSAPKVTVAPEAQTQAQTQTQVQTPPTAKAYGPVKHAESLWRIAHNLKPNGNVTTNQVMVALLNKNPNAFIGNNINGLKSGYTLRVPVITEVNKTSAEQATLEVAAHNQAWQTGQAVAKQQQFATEQQPVVEQLTAVGNNEFAPQAIEEQAVVEQVTTAQPVPQEPEPLPTVVNEPVEKPAPVMSVQQQRAPAKPTTQLAKLQQEVLSLKLLDLQPDTVGGAESNAAMQTASSGTNNVEKTLRAELAISAEGLNTAKEANALLKQQLKNLQQQNAALQQQLTALEARISNFAPANQNQAGGAKPVSVQKQVTQIRKVAPAVAGQGSEITLEEQSQTPWGIIGLIILLVLVGIGAALAWLVFKRQDLLQRLGIPEQLLAKLLSFKKVAPATKEDDYQELPTTNIDAESAAHKMPTETPESSHVTARQTDPLEEANVYLTYKRYDEAQHVLEKAIQAEPAALKLRVKLLEVHVAQKDETAFKQVLINLPADFGRREPELHEQVKALRNNFLGEVESTPVESNAESTIEPTVEVTPAVEIPEIQPDAAPETPLATEDFSIDVSEEPIAAEPTIAEEPPAAAEPPAAEVPRVLEFESGLGGGLSVGRKEEQLKEEQPEEKSTATPDVISESGEDLKLPGAGGALDALAGDDVVATKLDLATAYISMDDKDGAIAILNEVIREGNAKQQQEAQALLGQIK